MNVLLVGLGGMGTAHYKNYLHIPRVKVTAAVGQSDADRATARQWGIPLYATIREACERHEVDLVDVCAPTYLHKALVLEALACKKHTITEKPVALSYADAKEMYAAAESAGVQLYVAQVLQFTREIETLRTVTEDGRYGRALDGCFERLSARPAWTQGGWLFDRSKSGLLPFDLHIHDLDVIVSIFGKPESVAYTAVRNAQREYGEQYRFTYGFADGVSVSAEAAWFNATIPFTARWRVYYERGILICDEHGVTGYAADGEITRFDVEEPVKVDCGVNLGESGWFLRELTHLTDCAKRAEPSPLVPKERILDVMEILERIE